MSSNNRENIKTLSVSIGEGVSPSVLCHIAVKAGADAKSQGWDEVLMNVQSHNGMLKLHLTGVRKNGN